MEDKKLVDPVEAAQKARTLKQKYYKRYRIDGAKIKSLDDLRLLIDVLGVQLPGDMKNIDEIKHILTEIEE